MMINVPFCHSEDFSPKNLLPLQQGKRYFTTFCMVECDVYQCFDTFTLIEPKAAVIYLAAVFL